MLIDTITYHSLTKYPVVGMCQYKIYLTEMGVMHESGYVYLIWSPFVPSPIWILTSVHFFIIWEVLLANAHVF